MPTAREMREACDARLGLRDQARTDEVMNAKMDAWLNGRGVETRSSRANIVYGKGKSMQLLSEAMGFTAKPLSRMQRDN